MRRPRQSSFKRQALLLFFIVSLTPALTVSALWYYFTRDSGLVTVEIGQYVAPLALLGLAPAIVLSVAFAELLVLPIRRIHEAIRQLSAGNLGYRINFNHQSEFADMAHGLNQIASDLEQILSQSRGELELINAERGKLRTVLDSMSDGVVALDSGHAIILYNRGAAEMSGRSLAAAGGQIFERVLPLQQDGVPVVSEWLIRPELAASMEWHGLELQHPDGTTHYLDVSAVRPPADPSGIKVLMTLRDQTKAIELEKMKIDFVALAAHELRTPLTSIKSALDLLKTELTNKLDTSQKSFFDRSTHAANQLLGLVNNLLNVSRIEHGEINYNYQTVDWGNFLSQATKDLGEYVTNEQRVFKLVLPKRAPKLEIDSFAITQVLANLISNAVKHTKAGDSIEVVSELTPNKQEIQTIVRDTGSGIPKQVLPKLFHKFYRVEGLKSRGGTGLGLYIAKSIIEAHGGYVWVESEVGQGSSFGFNLPVAAKRNKHDTSNQNLIKGTHGWIKR